ncbi:MAG: PstS family phosphate ABC transporter substrate-binding protein [Planctomycetia bacterium]|nr:MAG: PstS family phosphate ABC transporter substrate-binding protein [Planctomycetia bacterium]
MNSRNRPRRLGSIRIAAVALVSVAGVALAMEPLTGKVAVDGSSTVAPIMKAAAELFRAEQPRVTVTVGVSGTGGGFKKFFEASPELRTDITNASRPIKPSELSKAAETGVHYIELPIAFDGIAVVVNPKNSFCDSLTIAELRAIWAPGSTIRNWKDVRPGFPDMALKLYGPGHDSGTFDYFTEAVVGTERHSRNDYTANEDDNVLVRGVEGDAGALGYFGFAYYQPNAAKLKLLAIDSGDGKPVKPSPETIGNGSYHPLGRPLFIYVNADAAQRPAVKALIEFTFANAKKIVEHRRVNYVALPQEIYDVALRRFREGVTGTVYAPDTSKTRSLAELYGATERK